MEALIIIDMQEAYVGESRNRKLYHYEAKTLIKKINERIERVYLAQKVIYIKNKAKLKQPSALVKELKIVSELCFEKSKASCFSNPELLVFLQENEITKLELAGVDGNFCVGMSAIDGAKKGLDISISLSRVGVGNSIRFQSTKEKLLKAGVKVCE